MTPENHLQRAERAEAQVVELCDRVKELDNEVVNATRITSISQDRYQKAEARVKELEAIVSRLPDEVPRLLNEMAATMPGSAKPVILRHAAKHFKEAAEQAANKEVSNG